MQKLKIKGVDVFLEKRKTRMHVGILTITNDRFKFCYDDVYFYADHVIPLGPEFPLTQKEFISEELFPSFVDRIPSKQNPAYPDYCRQMGIDPLERNPLVLLSTIGRKGPSSFIFSPWVERHIYPEELVAFRKSLGLTTRDFAKVFEFSQTAITAFEGGKIAGKDVGKRLEILLHFPEVALQLLKINSGQIVFEKWEIAAKFLEEKLKQKGCP